MATAKQLPSGQWRIQPTANGQRVSITAPTRQKAELLAHLWQDGQERRAGGHLSITSAIDVFLKDSANVLSPSTMRAYEGIRKRLEKYELTHTMLDYARPEMYQRLINQLSRKYSPKTVRNTWALITATIRFYGLKAPEGINLPKEERKRYNVPTDADVKALLDACAGTDFEVAIMLAAFGGLRRSEIVALTSDDIDGNTVHVHAAIVKGPDKKYHEKGTKTYSSDRVVLLPDFVIDRIKGIDGHLYPHPAEGITKRFILLRSRLGLSCRFHDLRHYSASKMHAIGVPDQYIIGRHGWRTDYALKSIYRNELDDVAVKMNNRINSEFKRKFSKTDAHKNAHGKKKR